MLGFVLVEATMGKAGTKDDFKCNQQGWNDGWGQQTVSQVREKNIYRNYVVT